MPGGITLAKPDAKPRDLSRTKPRGRPKKLKDPAKPVSTKELREIIKLLKEIREILDNMWRERLPERR